MRLFEIENFDASAIYLHGGPKNLDGGLLKRHGYRGHDSGALFFIKDTNTGRQVASAYAIRAKVRYGEGVIWKAKLHISAEQIFDFSNPSHRELAKSKLSNTEFESWIKSSSDGHIDWTSIDEEIIHDDWGFVATYVFERSKGFAGYDDNAISIGVFDPSVVELIDYDEISFK
ncbi:MAG: hypothetical protein WC284_11765 [Candidimonas sp.]